MGSYFTHYFKNSARVDYVTMDQSKKNDLT